MLKAVIFDMDGVLVDSEPLHYEVNKLTVEEQFGIDLNYEYYKQYVGTTVLSMWEKIIKDFSIEGYTASQLFELSEKIKERLVGEKGYPKVEGAVEFVRLLSSKYKLAVASSSALINIERNLFNLKIKDEFDKLVTGLLVENPKPAPDVFLKAAKELSVQPSECIVIEDSRNGVKAAKAAGMACIGFLNPNSGEQDLSDADYLFESFENIDDGFLEMVYSHHFGEPWRVFETERLVIREMCPDDVDDIFAIYEGNDLKYIEGLYDDKDKELEYIKDYQKYIYNFYDFGIWLFEEKLTGEIIGRGGVELKMNEDGTQGLELGYIVKKDRQRKGFAYEALSGILIYLHEHFDIANISVRVHKENLPSIELAKKLGAIFSDEINDEHITGIIEFM